MTRRSAVLLSSLALLSSPVVANVVGNDTQNFNPVTGAGEFTTVQSSATLAPGRFSLGLFVDDAVNSLPYKKGEHQDRAEMNDSLVGTMLGVGIGVLPGVELGVAAPFIAKQQIKDDDTRGEFAARGNTEIRPMLKWAFVRQPSWGLAAVVSANIDRVQDDPYQGDRSAPVYNAELAADQRVGRMALGVNLGYRARQPGEKLDGALVAPMSDQALASAAACWHFLARTCALGEVYGARAVKALDNETDRAASSAEALVGVRHEFAAGLIGHAGAGTELIHGFGTPDWRLYAGVQTQVGPSGPKGRTVVEKKKKKAKPAPEAELAKYEPNEDNGPGIDQIPTGAPDDVFVLHNIEFEFDSDYRVLPGALGELDKLMEHLAKHPYAKLVVEGHTDYYGTYEYNDDLSLRRARTVRRQLVKHHSIDPNIIIATGYGKRQPITDDPSDAGRQRNRRVEIKIFYQDN